MTALATIGALRQRVTLEVPIDSPDGAGGFSQSYAPVAQLWARITPTGTRQDFVAERVEQTISHSVTIRWREGVTSGMRFVHRGRSLVIRAVFDPDERRHFLQCQCEEIS